MEFNEKLQELRKQKGLTQEELSALSGVSHTAKQVYDTIVRRFLSIFYPPPVYHKVSITTQRKEEQFFANFKVLSEEGYLKVAYAYKKEDDTTKKWSRPKKKEVSQPVVSYQAKQVISGEEYLLVDGYNIIFAWEELSELARENLDAARGRLLDILCNYQGIKKCNLIAVFDAYRIAGHKTETLDYHNIHVVFTKEAETADQYIEKFAYANGKKDKITVATSDGLEQIIITGAGCHLLSAHEFEKEVRLAVQTMKENYVNQVQNKELRNTKTYLLDRLSEEEKKRISTEE